MGKILSRDASSVESLSKDEACEHETNEGPPEQVYKKRKKYDGIDEGWEEDENYLSEICSDDDDEIPGPAVITSVNRLHTDETSQIVEGDECFKKLLIGEIEHTRCDLTFATVNRMHRDEPFQSLVDEENPQKPQVCEIKQKKDDSTFTTVNGMFRGKTSQSIVDEENHQNTLVDEIKQKKDDGNPQNPLVDEIKQKKDKSTFITADRINQSETSVSITTGENYQKPEVGEIKQNDDSTFTAVNRMFLGKTSQSIVDEENPQTPLVDEIEQKKFDSTLITLDGMYKGETSLSIITEENPQSPLVDEIKQNKFDFTLTTPDGIYEGETSLSIITQEKPQNPLIDEIDQKKFDQNPQKPQIDEIKQSNDDSTPTTADRMYASGTSHSIITEENPHKSLNGEIKLKKYDSIFTAVNKLSTVESSQSLVEDYEADFTIVRGVPEDGMHESVSQDAEIYADKVCKDEKPEIDESGRRNKRSCVILQQNSDLISGESLYEEEMTGPLIDEAVTPVKRARKYELSKVVKNQGVEQYDRKRRSDLADSVQQPCKIQGIGKGIRKETIFPILRIFPIVIPDEDKTWNSDASGVTTDENDWEHLSDFGKETDSSDSDWAA